MRKFDLNIEEVLEDWEVYHAIREIIANVLKSFIETPVPEKVRAIPEDDAGELPSPSPRV